MTPHDGSLQESPLPPAIDSTAGAVKPPPVPAAVDLSHHISAESRLRQQSRLKMASSYLTRDPSILSLAAGLPSPALFPIEEVTARVAMPQAEAARSGVWKGDGLQEGVTMEFLKTKRCTELGKSEYDLSRALQYEQGTGSRKLLDFLKEHTERIHHPQYSDWDCIMTGGNTHAMETVFRMLINPGDYVLLEEFAFPETVDSLRPLRPRLIGIDVDEEGMRVDLLADILDNWDEEARGGKRPHLMYMVPTGQNPTGATIGTERRKKIYALACKYDLVIIEDDPYYFLQMPAYVRHGTSPSDGTVPVPKTNAEFVASLVPSMLSLDSEGRVLRLDSFSKVIAPGTRCGWITGAAVFVERVLRHNEVGLQFPSGISMAVLHGLLVEAWGQDMYVNWLVNLRAEYTVRRDVILKAMDEYLPSGIASWTPPAAGMFVWIELSYEKHPRHGHLSKEEIEMELFEAGIAKKVLIMPGSWFKAEPEKLSRAIFFRATFAAVPPEQVRAAIRQFGEVVRSTYGVE
ncbi:putative aromatic aminotransferase Aro8 [Myxozyma melibiosi]|uniref:Aromatic aminotransferase Aro8 n=1 Tax=Myxozyma melibiosi TaxID=54550 RepID=A0ABR1F6A9_9ASCO